MKFLTPLPLLAIFASCDAPLLPGTDWTHYLGHRATSQYSPLGQIDTASATREARTTAATYSVGGKQFEVVACGGGKPGTKSGG